MNVTFHAWDRSGIYLDVDTNAVAAIGILSVALKTCDVGCGLPFSTLNAKNDECFVMINPN